jgi:hypothetical protein
MSGGVPRLLGHARIGRSHHKGKSQEEIDRFDKPGTGFYDLIPGGPRCSPHVYGRPYDMLDFYEPRCVVCQAKKAAGRATGLEPRPDSVFETPEGKARCRPYASMPVDKTGMLRE